MMIFNALILHKLFIKKKSLFLSYYQKKHLIYIITTNSYKLLFYSKN